MRGAALTQAAPVGVAETRTAERMEVDADAIDRALAGIPASEITLRCPANLSAGTPAIATLTIAHDFNGLLRQALRDQGVAPERANGVAIALAASLTADQAGAFDITSIVSSGDNLQKLAWNVTPKQGGQHMLTLRATLTASAPGVNRERVLPLLTRTVDVSSSPASGGSFPTIWIWPVIGVGGAAVAWLLYGRRTAHV